MQRKALAFSVLAVLLASGLAVEAKTYKSVIDYITRHTSMETALRAFRQLPGFEALYSTRSPRSTLFLPSDGAFNRTAAELNITVDALFKDTAYLRYVMTYHMFFMDKMTSKQTPLGTSVLTMANGKNLTSFKRITKRSNASITFTDSLGREAKIIKFDATAGRCIVHVLNKVLMPPPFVPNDNPFGNSPDGLIQTLTDNNLNTLRTLAIALLGLDKVDSIKDMTILAPTNEAFAPLIALVQKQLGNDLSKITELQKKVLVGILDTHFFPGEIFASNLTHGRVLTSYSRARVIVDLKSKPGSIMLNVTRVPSSVAIMIDADIEAPKGIVIHKINHVLSNVNLTSIRKR